MGHIEVFYTKLSSCKFKRILLLSIRYEFNVLLFDISQVYNKHYAITIMKTKIKMKYVIHTNENVPICPMHRAHWDNHLYHLFKNHQRQKSIM